MADRAQIEVTGSVRENALRDIHRQLGIWDLKMPDVEPLVLDFGLGRFTDIGETEFWVANEEEHGYCGKFLFVFDEQTCPYHHHKVKHETFFVVVGEVRMEIDGEERTVEQGETIVMPPETGHSFTGLGPALILEVSMPSVPGDSYFRNKEVGDSGVI